MAEERRAAVVTQQHERATSFQGEQELPKELVVDGQDTEGFPRRLARHESVFLKHLPVSATNVVQVTSAQVSCWVPPLTVAIPEQGTTAEFFFHELALDEELRVARFIFQNKIDGRGMSRILIEDRSVVILEAGQDSPLWPSYLLPFKGRLDRSKVVRQYERPYKVEQHGLAAQSVVEIVMEREAFLLGCPLRMFSADILGDWRQDDIGGPVLPP